MGRTKTVKTDFKRYPATPEELSQASQALWVSITRQFRSDHFSAADLALLLEFCRSSELIDECNEIVRREGSIVQTPQGIKSHPAIQIRNGEIRNMATIGTKLRLPLSSRFRAESRSNDPLYSSPAPWANADGLIKFPEHEQ